MKSALQIRLHPSPEQCRILDGQSKIACWLYNRLLDEANHLREEYRLHQDPEVARTLYSKRGLRNLVPRLKLSHPFLRTVHSSPLKNAALRLTNAVQNYQDGRQGRRKGRPPGWPHFQSWKQDWFSLLYDEPDKGWKLASPSVLHLTLGVTADGRRLTFTLPLAELVPRAYRSRLATCRISKVGPQYFATFTVERPLPRPKPIRTAVAIDPNHRNLGYGVGTDGRAMEIENLGVLKALDRRIDELQSHRDRCRRRAKLVEVRREDGSVGRHSEPSRRWQFFDDKVARLRQVRRDQTKQYLYSVAHRLCREYDLIGIGDYAPHGGGLSTGMRRAMNTQSLIGRFKEVLAWVAARSGKHFVEYGEHGTTRECHACGCVRAGLTPQDREWVCGGCGTAHIRDENAAQNGLRRILRQRELPCSGHTPVTVRWTWRYDFRGVAAAARESNVLA